MGMPNSHPPIFDPHVPQPTTSNIDPNIDPALLYAKPSNTMTNISNDCPIPYGTLGPNDPVPSGHYSTSIPTVDLGQTVETDTIVQKKSKRPPPTAGSGMVVTRSRVKPPAAHTRSQSTKTPVKRSYPGASLSTPRKRKVLSDFLCFDWLAAEHIY